MKPLTRNAIAYNLHVSPHVEDITYKNGNELTFVFSSDLYRRKFLERREEMKKEVEEIIYRRFKVRAELEELSDVRLYTQIEKRGFLIYQDNKEVTCLNNLKFVGVIKIEIS